MNENITTLQNKLTWATGAIKQAIETMTPPEGRRDYNKHTVACRENLQGILKLIETPEAKAEARKHLTDKEYSLGEDGNCDTHCNWS
jgi:hypothetical protein